MGSPFILAFTIFLLVPSLSLVYAFELPNNDTFSKWSRILEKKLTDLVTNATQVNFARSVYKSAAGMTLQNVDGEELMKRLLKKLNSLFANKKSALKKLVTKAEEEFFKFEEANKSLLNLEDLSFLNMKALKPALKMEFSPRFRQPVVFEESGVHIPLEIFDGWMGPRYKEAWWHDVEILNGLNWSASLDEAFKENQKNHPDLRWQYFGSFFGFMRVYPAFRWPDQPSLPDLYDVRRRPWYIQGSVTPKDVIILVDRSGSVHGPTLDILKITARALLNTLGENDFVNVAWFNNKVRWVVPCLNTLVQATAQIRRLLGDAVERLTESNLTSYATALDFAFEEFKKFDEYKKPWMGSNCHKIIMFLSDGGTEWPTDLISRHCNESRNNRIKIFTFACGPHPIPTAVLKEMACSTGGYFSPVTALGSVRLKIRDYLKVLSRPLAYSKDTNMYQWHNFYRDIGGLGMVTTITLPVFNRGRHKSKSENLLGVMGIDIPVEEMTELFPKQIFGSLGYPFAINSNGFVVFHPRLRDHIIYIEDPPNIYLTDLEGTTENIQKMEKAIIDGMNGSLKNFQSITPVGRGHAVLVDMDYFYGSIEATTFRFGIALPSKHTTAKIKITNFKDSLSLLSSLKDSLIAPWKFCPTGNIIGDLTIEKLVAQLKSNYNSCDSELIDFLLWDVENVNKIKGHWNETVIFDNISSRFLMTRSGLTTYSSDLGGANNIQGNPLKNNIYRRASSSSGFVFSLNKETRATVTVARRIIINNSYVSAVVGVEMEHKIIQDVFEDTIRFGSESRESSSELLHFYLINDGGTIVASNVKNSKVGDFIGLHDPELLDTLILEGVLKREYRYNYQSWCYKDAHSMPAEAGPRQYSIFQVVYESLISCQWNFLYAAFTYLISGVSAWKKSENLEYSSDGGNYSCVTRSAWYYHGGIFSCSGVLSCGSHTRSFRSSFFPELMLVFLVTQPPCKDPQYYGPISLDPDEGVELQHCVQQQHYRLRTNKCYTHTPKEVPSDCGASSKGHAIFVKSAIVYESVLLYLQLMGNIS